MEQIQTPEAWSVAFTVLQVVFTIALIWFIRLLVLFSADLKSMEKRVAKLETSQAVDNERYRNIENIMAEFKEDFKCFKEDVKTLIRGKI